MGQKIHPLGFRLGVIQEHRSKWFAKSKNYPRLVLEDQKLRESVLKKYPKANIVDILIHRRQTTQDLETKKFIDVTEMSIYAEVAGKIVGRENSLTELQDSLEKLCQSERLKQNLPEIRIVLNVLKVKNPYSSASVIADFLIEQLEKRIPFRAALKKALQRIRLAKLEGIKIQISGRLNGAEIARSEWVRKGRVPLQTLRADIDYSAKTAKTIYGILGIKVWAFKGEKTS
uniref:ribosomal protein S3 n=1 Tax=Gayralia brasiliensis TaxID=1286870 RepID=UPI0024114FBB|nr:ribosomal protein S3 [Gayralia brasiliensis]YP_010733773.1 ribosomal protein S3 [Monostroma nitidum]WEG92970.1 ribosomal protein S3 [Gayralia brasiliensis]WEG93044.1 ribosomal protein S3 [Monostroma nitidum]